ncbi:alpha/beta fold hydrolase [Gordonia alkaliphila]|uniref:Class I poly(R)-hydroxyalkanoic acid synthase n=1 Tax=Gordonia alkaliphila TaxID=1053547 RepID=A0ABP8ZAQ8_9ACTN|nr:alpha/beta fold hydrolase [Gordonia alkaliphila]MCK0438811.1 alpha/beta fold hydrolase [Gordonia alkaliphila]
MKNSLVTRLSAEIDPVGFLGATARAVGASAKNPLGVARATGEFASRMGKIPGAATRVTFGIGDAPRCPESTRDRRFSDVAWSENPGYYTIAETYFAARSYALDLIEVGGDDSTDTAKARAFVEMMWDAISPYNSPFTNPKVLIKAINTGGKSLARGAQHALSDAATRNGKPLRVDMDAFTVGENMACTPGQVVYRNELMELIQYAPQTEDVHAVPMLASPPWINKYYVMDLAPDRSLIEWAIRHGRTVFAISYRNPDADMSSVTFDDYLELGIRSALEVVQEITGAPKVDLTAVCLGGAMAAIAAGTGDDRIGNLTLINTLLDYSNTGQLGLMTDPETLDKLEILMSKRGYLPGSAMADTFDILRANDLIFDYWVSRWMLGEEPPAFDLLTWNEDATNMPASMHIQYLRQLYGENLLAKGEFTICGETVDLSKFSGDVYVVGAVNDHVVPWTSSYTGARLFGSGIRYVQSNGGHIAGIVNPPNKRSWTAAVGDPEELEQAAMPADPEAWREAATVQENSWWEDWVRWNTPRAGERQAPPTMGSKANPPLEAAPGSYVRS